MSADVFHASVLADGLLPAVNGTLYTAPAGKRVIIKTITLVNTDATLRTINLYVNASGTSRHISPKDYELGANYKGEDDNNHTLYDGDLIEGEADAANVVSYVIEGVVSE